LIAAAVGLLSCSAVVVHGFLLQLAAEYLAWCPVHGADALEMLIETSPVSAEKRCFEVLLVHFRADHCSKTGKQSASHLLPCYCMLVSVLPQ
jgi:hypothetical protein